MDEKDIAEQAYKNGYEAGKRDAVKHGRWITPIITPWCFRCSECRNLHDTASNYCPYCGAKMDGEDDG